MKTVWCDICGKEIDKAKEREYCVHISDCGGIHPVGTSDSFRLYPEYYRGYPISHQQISGKDICRECSEEIKKVTEKFDIKIIKELRKASKAVDEVIDKIKNKTK